jgi:DNA replication protein DnaC
MMEVSKVTVETATQICDKHGPYEARVLLVRQAGVKYSSCPTCQAEFKKEMDELRAKREREQQAELKEEWRKRSHRQSRIPKRYLSSSFDSFKAETEPQKKVLSVCQDYVANWEAVREA